MKKHTFAKIAAACASLALSVSAVSAFSASAAGLAGDANCDNDVSLADAVLIMQSLANPNQFGENGSDQAHITREGIQNGDVNMRGNGITNLDALAIQKYRLDVIHQLPESFDPNASQTTQTTTTTTTWQMPATTTTINNQPVSNNGIPDLGTPMNANATAVADFRKGATPLFFASDGWENGDPFDCGWYEGQTSLSNGVLSLTIDKDRTGKYNYAGAEYRTADHYGYGYYETSMQAIANDGVVSSFFTYTGPSEDNPWDEIDIEILGKDPTKVQFNYYTDGKGGHEFMYDLGFDSSKAFHTYGFDWQPDHITWYVDGKPVYTANQNIPKTEGRIMMNTWPGRGVDEWLKHYNGNTPLTARYQWVTFNKGGAGSNNQPQQTTTTTTQWQWQPHVTTTTTTKWQVQPPVTTTTTTQWQPPVTTTTTTQWQPPVTTQPNNNGGSSMNSNAKMVADFRKGATPLFFASDGWENGDPFDCGWYEGQTKLTNEGLTLTINKDYTGKYNYAGAEYRTSDHYGYGYYETSMKAIKNDGVVSSFFTYTGESENNPWDEIDVEVLGKDTTKVQFNYYTNGQGGHEFMYDLGFDASQGFHTYGFDWQADHITWYVDGKAVYTANQNIPKTPGRIMMNTWPGRGVDEWLKHYDGRTPLTATYEWVTFDDKAPNGNNNNNNNNQNPWQPPQQTTTTVQQWQPVTTTTAKAGNALGIQDFGTPMKSNATAVADFRKGSTPLFFASDGWTNGDPFDCGWYEGNTSLDKGVLSLTIDRDYTGKYAYSGAEYRTTDHYGFGYYETSMQAIKNDGVVSSFFTYTGESENNPWDEIDIEILGKDTTKVQLNYYTNGKGGHEYMYDLGFDSSQGFHTYGFDWQRDHITWYVDGKAVYTAYDNIPQTPGRIMMNTWPGKGVDEWLKAYNGRTPLTAYYQWVTYNKQ